MPIDLRPGCCLDDRLGRPRVLVRRAVPLGRSAVGRRAEHPGWGGWPNVISTLEGRRAATAHRWLAATGVAGAVGRLPPRVRTARRREWLEYALVESRLPDDRDAALLLFDYLTEPHIALRPAFGLGPALVSTSASAVTTTGSASRGREC